MEENNKMDISRRGFLKTAALAGAAMAILRDWARYSLQRRNKRKHPI